MQLTVGVTQHWLTSPPIGLLHSHCANNLHTTRAQFLVCMSCRVQARCFGSPHCPCLPSVHQEEPYPCPPEPMPHTSRLKQALLLLTALGLVPAALQAFSLSWRLSLSGTDPQPAHHPSLHLPQATPLSPPPHRQPHPPCHPCPRALGPSWLPHRGSRQS